MQKIDHTLRLEDRDIVTMSDACAGRDISPNELIELMIANWCNHYRKGDMETMELIQTNAELLYEEAIQKANDENGSQKDEVIAAMNELANMPRRIQVLKEDAGRKIHKVLDQMVEELQPNDLNVYVSMVQVNRLKEGEVGRAIEIDFVEINVSV